MSEPLEQRMLLSADLTPPTVHMAIRYFMSAPQWIILTYDDNRTVDWSSINKSDVRVEGPNGFRDIAQSAGSLTNSLRSVRYRFPAPGGAWDAGEGGRYNISFTRPIKDEAGNAIRSLKLGHIDVVLSGLGRLAGHVTNDDPQGMKGVTVYLDANNDSTFNAGELSVLSDASGAFGFELPVGSYRVREVVPGGFDLVKSLPARAPQDDPGTGGGFDVEVTQSTINHVGTFINSLSLSFLDINGTDADDQITVEPDPSGVKVTINGVSAVQSLSGVNTLRVHGGNGNDAITIDPGIQLPARIFGEAGNDTLRGGDGGGTIRGGDGADEIFGGAGNDSISGSNDLLPCGPEELSLADLADTIHGGGGDDSIYGGNGNDQMFGDGGNDRIRSSSGAATIHGGDGDDIINARSDGHIGHGEDGGRVLYGDGGNDQIDGSNNWDRLFGGGGNDTLNGGSGQDKLYGGSGNDLLVANDSAPDRDHLDGGRGRDRADVDFEDRFSKVELPKKHVWGDGAKITSPNCLAVECFLTTAVVHWAGKADDCHELTVLRQFRDSYMWRLPQGPQMIRDYYEHAPRVVRAIEEQGRGEVEWPVVYAMVQKAVGLIEAGQNAEALALYSTEYLRLKAEYVEVAVV